MSRMGVFGTYGVLTCPNKGGCIPQDVPGPALLQAVRGLVFRRAVLSRLFLRDQLDFLRLC